MYPATFAVGGVPGAPAPRESRRLLGPVILRKEDLMEQRQWEDGCMVTGWDMDLHLPHGIPQTAMVIGSMWFCLQLLVSILIELGIVDKPDPYE